MFMPTRSFPTTPPAGRLPKFAWLARKAGLAVAGIVDFDVLDGLEGIHGRRSPPGPQNMCQPGVARVLPRIRHARGEFPRRTRAAYHMGVGFARPVRHAFLDQLRATAERRTRELLQRVNAFLRPVELDYAQDVVPLTPRGNATEALSLPGLRTQGRPRVSGPHRA